MNTPVHTVFMVREYRIYKAGRWIMGAKSVPGGVQAGRKSQVYEFFLRIPFVYLNFVQIATICLFLPFSVFYAYFHEGRQNGAKQGI